jgi:hypothetical protein
MTRIDPVWLAVGLMFGVAALAWGALWWVLP